MAERIFTTSETKDELRHVAAILSYISDYLFNMKTTCPQLHTIIT